MLRYKDNLQIPFEELAFITPDVRTKLFYNMLENYKVFCPGLKRRYAFLNFDSSNPIDYLVIFEYIEPGDPDKPNSERHIILWDMPFIYTSRSIPGYRYVVKNKLYKEFYNDAQKHFSRMTLDKFLEFIPSACNLSLNKSSDLYWKKEENSKMFIKNMIDISLLYTPFK